MKTRRWRIYVAGPYSADKILQVFKNMSHGIDMSTKFMTLGEAPFSPFIDFHFALNNPNLTVPEFYAYSMSWLDVSDYIYVLKGWETSVGTKKEIEKAEQLNIPIFYEDNCTPEDVVKEINKE